MKKMLLPLLLLLVITSCAPVSYEGHFTKIIQSHTEGERLHQYIMDANGYMIHSVYQGEVNGLSLEGLVLIDKQLYCITKNQYKKLDNLFFEHFSLIPEEMELDQAKDGEDYALQIVSEEREEKREGRNASLDGPEEFVLLYQAFSALIEEASEVKG